LVKKIEPNFDDLIKSNHPENMKRNINNTISTDFETYLLGYYSADKTMTARIYCFKGDKRVGTVEFVKDGVTIQDNFYDPSAGGWGIYLYYKERQFSDILTILQTVGPLNIWIETNSKVGGIVTQSHNVPVGTP
jgi:hypothetical protein